MSEAHILANFISNLMIESSNENLKSQFLIFINSERLSKYFLFCNLEKNILTKLENKIVRDPIAINTISLRKNT